MKTGWPEWMAAWFGGSAFTAFQEHDPVFGWTAAVITLGFLAADILLLRAPRRHD